MEAEAFGKSNTPTTLGELGSAVLEEGSYTNVLPAAISVAMASTCPPARFFDEFETWEETIGSETITKVDPRRGYTIFKLGENAAGWGNLEETTGMLTRLRSEILQPFIGIGTFGDPNPNGGSNDRVIRLADVILMHAEACYHLGDDAIESLNLVRNRASSQPWMRPPGQDLLDAIYHERRVELDLGSQVF